MCLLMVTMGELPKREYLVNASENNPDGYGFAVHHGDNIVTGRSMKYEHLIDRFYAEMAKSENPIGVFHARYTTHGKTTLENNHPFRVDGRKDIILAHNGMLPITPRAGDDRSDTRIFAEDVLGAIGIEALDDKKTFQALETFAAGSKLAILTTAPALRDTVYILNEHLGHWDGNIWWSNSGYMNSYYSFGSKSYSTKSYSGGYYGSAGAWESEMYKNDGHIIGRNWWNDPDDEYVAKSVSTDVVDACYTCGQALTEADLYDGVCTLCNSCLDCFEHAATCMCYTPSKVHSSVQLLDYEY